jgi:Glycosyltransferase family 87
VSATDTPRTTGLDTNRLLVWLICLAAGIVMLAGAFEAPELGSGKSLMDFDAFYIVSQMIHEGTLTQAYDTAFMGSVQKSVGGEGIFMPWTYPPHYDLVISFLAFGSRGLAYGVFISLTFVCYVFTLHRLAGKHVGQNGLLTGALAGLFCLAILRGGAVAGVPLGLMVIKPHLAIGFGVMVLVTQRWKVLLIGLAVVAIFSALATWAFGMDVWPAFLQSVPEAQRNMAEGNYLFFRMTSIYAALLMLGVSAGTAMITQAFVALAACAAILMARLKGMSPRQILGISCFATLAISPFNHDYDMMIMGTGLAVIVADLMERTNRAEKLVIFALSWLTCGWGMVINTIHYDEIVSATMTRYLSLGAFGHLSLFLFVCYILLRRKPSFAEA